MDVKSQLTSYRYKWKKKTKNKPINHQQTGSTCILMFPMPHSHRVIMFNSTKSTARFIVILKTSVGHSSQVAYVVKNTKINYFQHWKKVHILDCMHSILDCIFRGLKLFQFSPFFLCSVTSTFRVRCFSQGITAEQKKVDKMLNQPLCVLSLYEFMMLSAFHLLYGFQMLNKQRFPRKTERKASYLFFFVVYDNQARCLLFTE